jgi:DNA-binding HxlR family transcriptional regulator
MRKIKDLPECPVATTITLIGNKWKLLIIRNLMERPWRFNELQKSLNGISQKVLTDSLRQLEKDGIIFRKDYHTNPPKVEYGITDLGLELSKMLKVMASFGEYYKSKL